MIGIVQFYVPRLAADAVNVSELKFRARARGMETASAEISYYRTGGRCRVTCRSPVAELLVAELEAAIAGATKEAIRSACVEALTTVQKELERTYALGGALCVQRGKTADGRSVIGC